MYAKDSSMSTCTCTGHMSDSTGGRLTTPESTPRWGRPGSPPMHDTCTLSGLPRYIHPSTNVATCTCIGHVVREEKGRTIQVKKVHVLNG